MTLQESAILAFQRHEMVRGAHGFTLWAVLDWDEPVIGYYKKLGAVPLSDWTVFRLTGEALDELAS